MMNERLTIAGDASPDDVVQAAPEVGDDRAS
jgi:hypothetical protein